MKITILSMGTMLALGFAVMELGGCGSPPEVPSAQKEIHNAEGAMERANNLMQHQQYDMAVIAFDEAVTEIKKGELFAEGNELARLGMMKKEVVSLKLDCESKARRKAGEASAKLKPAVTTEPVAKIESDADKHEAEKAKAAALAANEKAMQDAINKPKAAKKIEEPEDAGDVSAAKKGAKDPNAAASVGDKEPPAIKAAPKDKNGIYPDITDNAPPFQIFKLTRVGKFVLAYCRYHNTGDDGKNITVATFFKDHDNQVAVPPLTTAAFPYDRFSVKPKDLIGEQSVNNLAPGKEGVNGHEYLDFVTVGECQNEEAAGHVVKVYVKVSFGDGKSEEATFEGAAAALPVPKVKL